MTIIERVARPDTVEVFDPKGNFIEIFFDKNITQKIKDRGQRNEFYKI